MFNVRSVPHYLMIFIQVEIASFYNFYLIYNLTFFGILIYFFTIIIIPFTCYLCLTS
jgi:hypothetical protein